MKTLSDLPADVFYYICKNLDTVEDVLSLQCTSKLFNLYINKTFWGTPKYLSIGAENTSQLFFDNGNKMVIMKPTMEKMSTIVSKMRNMKEIFLSRDDQRINNDMIGHVISSIQENGKYLEL